MQADAITQLFSPVYGVINFLQCRIQAVFPAAAGYLIRIGLYTAGTDTGGGGVCGVQPGEGVSIGERRFIGKTECGQLRQAGGKFRCTAADSLCNRIQPQLLCGLCGQIMAVQPVRGEAETLFNISQ